MAAVDYFLKLDGIDGESTDHKHKGEIAVQSWAYGAIQGGSVERSAVGGGGAGKVQMQDFHFTAQLNKASPKLLLACAAGEHIKKAVLTCRKAGKDQQEFLKYTLTDVFVTSYHAGGSGQTEVIPVEQFSLNFATIEKEYKEQKPDGTLGAATKVGWSVKENKKL